MGNKQKLKRSEVEGLSHIVDTTSTRIQLQSGVGIKTEIQ
jgi:hypothetical protein